MNTFEKTIKAYLDNVAQSDAVFAQKYDEAKIEGCCSYIISEVRKSGRQGFADEEIYGMAVHYFDEGLESPAGAVKCDVVVNHTIELTEEEKAQMKEKALAEYKEKIILAEQEKADKARKAEEAKAKKAAEKEKVRKEEEERKRKERERRRQAELLDEDGQSNADYRDRLGKMLGVIVNVGDIELRPLQSIKEFYEEGEAMHHCVFTNGYYRKDECLIIGARVNGERAETIEIDTEEWRIIQCRGKHNQDSQYHEVIMEAMTNNISKYRRMAL